MRWSNNDVQRSKDTSYAKNLQTIINFPTTETVEVRTLRKVLGKSPTHQERSNKRWIVT